jgi:Holliday junction resolvase
MVNPSKTKGNKFERELVNQAKGIAAKRAYASNGQSLGLTADVDCLVGGFAVQAKRRKAIASYITPSSGADVQIIRADRQKAMAVMPYELFLELITQPK